jgi:hypothetical protein
MAEAVAPEFASFIADERRARRLPAANVALLEGELASAVLIATRKADALVRVAARRAAGLYRPSKHEEVIWVQGGNELAIGIAAVRVKLETGIVRVLVPVRCDQVGKAVIEVLFVCGSPAEPAGLYAATNRRPTGPPEVLELWGDGLVSFAWQCVLGRVTWIAAATGKDGRGNVLVPSEISVTARGLAGGTMGRHRFSGSSTLKVTKPAMKPKAPAKAKSPAKKKAKR